MKQTAVEWLINEFKANDWWYLPQSMKEDIIEQAKEMEKQQIIDAYYQIGKDHQDMIFAIEKNAEQYYKETFKSE